MNIRITKAQHYRELSHHPRLDPRRVRPHSPREAQIKTRVAGLLVMVCLEAPGCQFVFVNTVTVVGSWALSLTALASLGP